MYERAIAAKGHDLDLILAPFDYPEIWDALTRDQQERINIMRNDLDMLDDQDKF